MIYIDGNDGNLVIVFICLVRSIDVFLRHEPGNLKTKELDYMVVEFRISSICDSAYCKFLTVEVVNLGPSSFTTPPHDH